MTYDEKKRIIVKDFKESPYDTFQDYINDCINHWKEEIELTNFEIVCLMELSDIDIEMFLTSKL